MKAYFASCILALSLVFSNAQDLELPKELADFVFTQAPDGTVRLISLQATYVLDKKWKKTALIPPPNTKDSLALYHPKGLNNNNYISFYINNQLHLVLNGGGYVLKLSNNRLERIDNSVDQKNQIDAAHVVYKNQLYIYGGYGFWSFKDYITYFDFKRGQWEYLVYNSKYSPSARWKPLFKLIGDKLFVLGGRANLKNNNDIDVILKDVFVYDFKAKTFEKQGEYNPKIPVKYSNGTGFNIGDKIAYITNDKTTIIDFVNNEFKVANTKKLFKNIDFQKPVFEYLDTLYYIKKKKNQKFLSKLPLNKLEQYNFKTYPLKNTATNTNSYWTIAMVMLIGTLTWVFYSLFRYKDFLKTMVLYDEKNLYYGGQSIQITIKQHKAIEALGLQGQITASELNVFISSKKKFAKSHLTLLRQNFIKELNKTYTELTKIKAPLIREEKDPNDRRYLVYKTTQAVIKKYSFWTFLFKR